MINNIYKRFDLLNIQKKSCYLLSQFSNVYFSCWATVKQVMSTCPGLNLVQFIFSCLAVLTNPDVYLSLATGNHQDLSQPMKTTFSQSEEVFYRLLKVNTQKTKVMVFRKGGRLRDNISFYYDGSELEIVNKFVYLGVTFTTGGSFHETQNRLAGKGLKAIFKMNKYLYKFTDISIKHRLDLFDKLIVPILCYGADVWGFIQAPAIERVHLRFLKTILRFKTSTPNDLVYAELGRQTLRTKRLVQIINYWFKILTSQDTKYIKHVYNFMLQDVEAHPNKVNWAVLVRNVLTELGFYEVWVQQGVGNYNVFISLFKQRLTDNYVQNTIARLQTHSRARFFNLFGSFQFHDYLNLIRVPKYK